MSTRNWNIVIFFGHFCNFSQSELFYLCRFHSDMATCSPTLFLLTVKEILLVNFIITNFRVAHKMLCTPWLRNPLTTSRLSCLGRKAPLTTIFLSIRRSTISHPWYTNNYLPWISLSRLNYKIFVKKFP
jgi:hypothetical protein